MTIQQNNLNGYEQEGGVLENKISAAIEGILVSEERRCKCTYNLANSEEERSGELVFF